MTKENDLVLNMVVNPALSLGDFKELGLNTTNTTIGAEGDYASNPIIMKNYSKPDGTFDTNKFHQDYTKIKQAYNILADDSYQEDLIDQCTFHRDNIFAPVEKRRKGPDFLMVKVQNPDRKSSSLIRLGKTEDSPLSVSEIAQTQKVLANPAEVAKGAKAEWHDAPNESWTTDFWDTRVLAQWDEEGDHVDPITGQTEHHTKGQLKLNDNGTYYYENLDGRDIYGRQVLNKMNTLTVDGSTLNKYDFFDSDDKQEKSAFGTLMKNAALVGSMFIPYVGPVVTTLSLATQGAGLFATLGKMLVGSDSPTLSAIEGWSNSVNRQQAKTEYAQQNQWCWENFIDLVGDVVGQFAEQRFLFEKAPKLFMDGPGLNNAEGEAAMKKTLEDELRKTMDLKKVSLETLQQTKDISKVASKMKEAELLITWNALKQVDSYLKNYKNLGEIFSNIYMTGITVADTYGEAKLQGASDAEASLLTMGYAAAEAALLRTGLGEWMFPELRESGMHKEAVARALVQIDKTAADAGNEIVKRSLKAIEGESKKDWAKRIFRIGALTAKDLYTGAKSTGEKTLQAAFFNALGEGTEEVSEELLADFSKGCFNVVNYLRGDDTRMTAFDVDWKDPNAKWNAGQMFDRYFMNFFGGAIGGGLAGMKLSNIKYIRNLNNMSSDQARQELIYMIRNGETQKFLSTLDKMTLGKKGLSASKYSIDEEGNVIWDPADGNDNQDYAAKQAIRQEIQLISDIMSSNNLQISDESFLKGQTDLLEDIKWGQLLSNTMASGRALQAFNSLTSKIITLESGLQTIDATKTDSEESKENLPGQTKIDSTAKKLRQDKEAQLKELLKERDAILNGERAGLFVADALFELSPQIQSAFLAGNVISYSELVSHKKYSELNDLEKETYKKLFDELKKGDLKDDMHLGSVMYQELSKMVGNILTKSDTDYQASQTDENLQFFQNYFANTFNPNILFQLDNEQFVHDATEVEMNGDEILANTLILKYGLDPSILQNARQEMADLDQKVTDEVMNDPNIDDDLKRVEIAKRKKDRADIINAKYFNEISKVIANNVEKVTEGYIKQGFIHTDAKNQLRLILADTVSNLKNQISNLADFTLNDKTANDEKEQVNKNSTLTPEEKLAKLDKIDVLVQTRMNLNLQIDNLTKLADKLDTLDHTPIEKILNQFSLNATGNPLKVTELVERVNSLLADKRNDLSNFALDGNLHNQLNQALKVIEMARAAIEGARIDDGSADKVFSYNSLVNKANSKAKDYVPLPEITTSSANVLLQDLAGVRNKLLFAKLLYAINNGLKLQKQNRVALNTNYMLLDKIKRFRSFLNEGNGISKESLDKLDESLNSLTTLNLYALDRNISLNEEDRKKVQQEMIKAEDALYDFWKANESTITDDTIKKLMNINQTMFNENDDILTEDTENIDDNSFIWWLASKFALKSSDIYGMYNQAVAGGKYAPLSTQTIQTIGNLAHILNGKVFDRFYDVYRNGLQEFWNNADEDTRRKILSKKYDEDSVNKLIDKSYDKYLFSFLPALKYKNIIFSEGIPGSGKTTAIDGNTFKVLKMFYPNSGILDNVLVIHCSDSEDATDSHENGNKLITNCELDPTKSHAMTISEAMKLLTVDWKPMTQETDGTYTFGNVSFTSGEPRTTLQINKSTAPYSIIVIDEGTKISAVDYDAILNYANYYGISVIVSGDNSQSGISGLADTNGAIPGSKSIAVNTTKNNFMHIFKQGITMRTANSLKTENLSTMLAYFNTKNFKETLKLKYYEDENGLLFGDKVIAKNWDGSDGIEMSELEDIEYLPEIDKIYANLNDGEKVGFVYTNEDSPTYRYIEEKYHDLTNFLPGTSAQGKEGRFYIVDLTNDGIRDDEAYIKDFYTAATRSEQGTLIIQHSNDGDFQQPFDAESVQELSTIDQKLPESAVKKYIEEFNKVVNEVNSNPTTPEYQKRIGSLSNPEKPEEQQQVELQQPAEGLQQSDELKEIQLKIDTINACTTLDALNGITTTLPDNLKNKLEIKDAIQKKANELNPPAPPSNEELKQKVNGALGQINNSDSQEELESIINGLDSEVANDALVKNAIENRKNYFSLKAAEYALKLANTKAQIQNALTREELINVSLRDFEGTDDLIALKELVLERHREFDEKDKQAAQLQGQQPPTEEKKDPEILDLEDPKSKEEAKKNLRKASKGRRKENVATVEKKKIRLNTYFYSLGTLWPGVQVDQDGKPVAYPGCEMRLDNVNGLMKLGQKTMAEYMNILGLLQNAVLNAKNKAELQTVLTSIMNNSFGILNIDYKFAFVSNSMTNNNGDFGRWSRQEDEPGVTRKGIYMILSDGTKDILDLPVLLLPNPVTVLESLDELESVRQFYDFGNDQKDLNVKTHEFIDAVNQLGKTFKTKYKDIIDLFKLYDVTLNLVVPFDSSNGLQDWLPSNNMENTGPHTVSEDRSVVNYEHPDQIWEPEFVSIDEFIHRNPGARVSLVYAAKNSAIYNNGNPITILDADGNPTENVFLTGKPFVIITYGDVSNPLQRYIEELIDPTLPKTTTLQYILAPNADVEDYFKMLDDLISGKKNLENIGNTFTAYNILKLLIDSGLFDLMAEESYGSIKAISDTAIDANPSLEEFRGLTIPQLIKKVVANIDAEAQRIKTANPDYTVTDINKELASGIFEQMVPKITSRNIDNVNYKGFLKEMLRGLVYQGKRQLVQDTFNQAHLDIIKLIINQSDYDLRYNATFSNSENAEDISFGNVETGVKIISLNVGFTVTTNNGSLIRPFEMFGQTDSPQFNADVDTLIPAILKGIGYNANDLKYYGKDKSSREDYKNRRFVNGSQNSVQFTESPKVQNLKNRFEQLLDGEWKNVDTNKIPEDVGNLIVSALLNMTTDADVEAVVKQFVDTVNTYTNRVAINLGNGDFIVSQTDLGDSAKTVTEVGKDQNGTHYTITSEGLTVNAVLNGNTLEVEEPQAQHTDPIILSEEEFTDYMSRMNAALQACDNENTYALEGQEEKLLSATNSADLVAKIIALRGASTTLRENLEDAGIDQDIIDKLVLIKENSTDNNKDACAIKTIKLQMI